MLPLLTLTASPLRALQGVLHLLIPHRWRRRYTARHLQAPNRLLGQQRRPLPSRRHHRSRVRHSINLLRAQH